MDQLTPILSSPIAIPSDADTNIDSSAPSGAVICGADATGNELNGIKLNVQVYDNVMSALSQYGSDTVARMQNSDGFIFLLRKSKVICCMNSYLYH